MLGAFIAAIYRTCAKGCFWVTLAFSTFPCFSGCQIVNVDNLLTFMPTFTAEGGNKGFQESYCQKAYPVSVKHISEKTSS